MFAHPKSKPGFLREERGAVTVEYVMLAAAITALALATTDVVQDGFRSLAGTIRNELRGDPVEAAAGLAYSDGFDNGADGWSGAGVADMDGIGNVLGPIAGSGGRIAVSRDFVIDPDAKEAAFDFDMLTLDSLDGEAGVIFIDGVEVGRVTSTHGFAEFTAAEGLAARGIAIRGEIIDQQTQLGGASVRDDRFRDSRTNIRITVAGSGTRTVSLGIGSTADQGVGDESIAIDNFTARGLNDPDRVRGV